jgi:ABC-type multidrug transport system fused ATPase/permease subunit
MKPETVLAAGKVLSILTLLTSIPILLFILASVGVAFAASGMLTATVASVLAREILVSHPARTSAKAADDVLSDSSETTNLMIMSLRHEHSVSRAIAFASSGEGRFKRELKACAWGVIMGKYASFEEALMTLGQKWSRFSGDLKASLNAMVTASREATEDGRRRALDRANEAMISGAKRRIEEYALSLSMPSMLIFGLGILLPLMVGSFMPMISWNIWSVEGLNPGQGTRDDGQTDAQMVFVMNILFPSIAALVAMNAVSGHPFNARAGARTLFSKGATVGLGVAVASGVASAVVGAWLLSGSPQSIWMLFSFLVPAAAWLILFGRIARKAPNRPEIGYEDVLFKMGARMLEGENFESSLLRACEDSQGRLSGPMRELSFGVAAVGLENTSYDHEEHGFGVMNALRGIRITKQAATKDELAAGMLAMDLAAYLKDLRDIEVALKNRLRPTMSMMKTTALVLAPIVLGVTYAIYLSLASMIGGQGQDAGAGGFFLVLGVFLAEMDAIVVYFMLGIEGEKDPGSMAFTLGSYLLVSETAFAATALVSSV